MSRDCRDCRDCRGADTALLRVPPHARDHDAIADLWGLVLPAAPPPHEQIVAFLPCEDGRPVSKVLCVVDGVPIDPHPDDMRATADVFARVVAQVAGGGLLAAIGRRGRPTVTEPDARWVEPLTGACRAHDVPLLGLWLQVAGERAVRLDAAEA